MHPHRLKTDYNIMLYLFCSIARHRIFASNSAEAIRTRTPPEDLVASQTALRRWRIRYATSLCRISTQARVVGRHSHRAHLRNYRQSHLLIIKLRTRAIVRIMKLVRIIRITVLSVIPFVIAGKWFNLWILVANTLYLISQDS